MNYLTLFLEFLKIGAFSFGGAYGAIPLIKETVLSHDWLSEEMFANIIAVSESTPGPIIVNTATYVGNLRGGVFGAALATLGVVLPSFCIIAAISFFLQKFLSNKRTQAVMSGVKPCISGMIIATGSFMAFTAMFGSAAAVAPDIPSMIIFAVLAAAVPIFKKLSGKEISPIALIVASAILGIILFGVFDNSPA